jgi:hypothetical protein
LFRRTRVFGIVGATWDGDVASRGVKAPQAPATGRHVRDTDELAFREKGHFVSATDLSTQPRLGRAGTVVDLRTWLPRWGFSGSKQSCKRTPGQLRRGAQCFGGWPASVIPLLLRPSSTKVWALSLWKSCWRRMILYRSATCPVAVLKISSLAQKCLLKLLLVRCGCCLLIIIGHRSPCRVSQGTLLTAGDVCRKQRGKILGLLNSSANRIQLRSLSLF